jgi:hypothetical protein
MNDARLNELLRANGFDTWQGMVVALGLRIAAAVAPQAMVLLERLLIAGAGALLTRLATALAPADAPDYCLQIVEGIEKMHGPGAPPADQWSGVQRAEWARDAIRQYLHNSGANPDDALVNELLERSVSRMRVKQEAAAKRAAGNVDLPDLLEDRP